MKTFILIFKPQSTSSENYTILSVFIQKFLDNFVVNVGVLSNIKHGGTYRWYVCLCLASFSFNINKHILNYTN